VKTQRGKRDGFTLIEVACAVIVLVVMLLGASVYFRNLFAQLDPRGPSGGLRRFLVAEQLLRAQAEGLRVLQTIPADAGSCRLVAPPAGTGFALSVEQSRVEPVEVNAELYYMDVSVAHEGKTVSTLSISTLRRKPEAIDEKIGL
jgi:prepilin-type N-terminal cleavage/methylation domain-containing protein